MRHRHAFAWAIIFLVAVTASLVVSPRAGAAPADAFPDDWFFSGKDRPAPLKELEGKPAPELSTQQWIGDGVKLSDLRGKVVVVDFWATWCGPCMASIPHNVELVDKYKDKGLAFVGIHDSNSGWDKADAVVKDKKINYPVALDQGGASTKAYNLQFWPTYVVIDHTGTVRAAGLVPDKVGDVVEALLKELPASGVAVAAPGASNAEWYYAPADRPKTLVVREGKPVAPLLPALDGPTYAKDRWIGAPRPPATWSNRVVVLHFFSPTNPISMRQLKDVDALAKDLEAQGVTFIGVCDATADPERTAALLKERGITVPILRDGLGKAESPAPQAFGDGTMTKSLGVVFAPTTIVVDRGGTLRVAGARVDKLKDIANKLLAERVTVPATGPASGTGTPASSATNGTS
jgi:thiol-disulfide isomerase/thioredoxin